MPRMGVNIRKRKDGRYEGRYVDGYKADGKLRYRSVYGKTYSEVKQKLCGCIEREKSIETLSNSENLVTQIAYLWLQSKKPYVKQSTYSRYLCIVEKYINAHFENVRVSELTNVRIQNFLTTILNDLKPKTARDILIVLKQVVDYADEQGLCNKYSIKIRLPKDNANTAIALTPMEQQRLMIYLKTNLDLHKLGIMICLYTGLRLGEICGLRWEDIDIANGVIKVRRTIQRIRKEEGGTKLLIDTPKTQKSLRDIPIPEFLLSYLCEYRCNNLEAYVLTGTMQFTQPRTYQNRFKVYMRSSELSENFHFHTLRHTFASRAIELGFDPKSLSEILGHANVNITLNRYVHSSMELKRNNMNRFQITE